MENPIDAVVWYVAFIFATTLHEASHALVAKWGGDTTAYEGGQVTIDPLPHIRREPIGMVVLPLLSLVLIQWPFGYASVPYNVEWANTHPRRAAWMSLAGPAANFALVIACGLAIQLGVFIGVFESPMSPDFNHIVVASEAGIWDSVAFLLSIFFALNLILMIFNLLPIPPLDGSGAVGLLLSDDQARSFRNIASQPMFGFIGLLLAWRFFDEIFSPVLLLALNLLYPGSGYAYR